MTDVFQECRERVSAHAAAEYYGYRPNRAGFILCPFHHEKTASLKLYDNGNFYCFGCGAGGSSIDFVARLYGLKPLEAVKRLDADFHLALPIGQPLTPAERQRVQQEAQRRQQLQDTRTQFEEWRSGMIQQLDSVFWMARLALEQSDTPEKWARLTAAQNEAIQWQPWAENTADILRGGTMAEQMEVFRDRKGVAERCNRILSNTPTRSGAV